LLRNSGGPRCVSRNMREIPSEMEFHGLHCSLKWNLSVGADANSDRNAHDTGRDIGQMKQHVLFRGYNCLESFV